MNDENGFVGIDDPDQPAYRIFPLWFFEEALRLRQLVLVPPQKWEDPFEQLPERSVIINKRTSPWSQAPIREFLKPAFGQCWSATRESDTLWRAYSRVSRDPHANRNIHPREEGVQVRSTPRKLLDALIRWAPTDSPNSCFIGSVGYAPEDQIQQYIANEVGRGGERAFANGKARAQLLFLKRPAFRHEAEVRLVYVEQRELPRHEVVRVPIDPNVVFDEVAFDPRLATFERREREQTAQNIGYRGPFSDSGLYRGRLLEIVVGEDPKQPPES